MKLLKILCVISIFALARSETELNAYALFRDKKPQEDVGVVWVKHDKGKKYVLLARIQEHGGLRGKADVYSFTAVTTKDRLPANVKVFAQDDQLTIYERNSTAWHKPKYHRWTYSWVGMDELKKAAETARDSGQATGVTVKTRMQEKEGKHYDIELEPEFMQLLVHSYTAWQEEEKQAEEKKKAEQKEKPAEEKDKKKG